MVKFSRALVGILLLASCDKAPLVWQGAETGNADRPSPLTFPAPQPFDAALNDTSAVSVFAHTQDLLREAGAQSMLTQTFAEQSALRPESNPVASGMAGMNHTTATMSSATWGELGAGTWPVDTARCGRSLRVVAVPGVGNVAVWWSKRDRNRVALVAAWRFGGETDTGAVWRGPIAIDTLDHGPADANSEERGATACRRPAPGLAADAHHYVHVSYALNAAEGPGVFYAHQMDPRSAFEPPQIIVYGEYLGTTRVAVDGDRVAVVYEDPNSITRTQIGVALSTTSGHGFVDRITASSSSSIARDPYVAVRGTALVVGWSELPSSSAEPPNFRLRRATLR